MKAMNLVYENRHQEKAAIKTDGVLKTWLLLNTTKTVAKFKQLEKDNFQKPIQISSNIENCQSNKQLKKF